MKFVDNQQYLKTLYPKLLNGTLSKDELLWLQMYLKSGPGTANMLALVTAELEIDDEAVSVTVHEQAVVERVYKHIAQERFRPSGSIGLKMWYRISAIAVCLLLIGGIYFFITNQTHAPLLVKHAKDFAPGSNKAILTLANGNKILLNSTSDRSLLAQQGVDTNQLSNGQLKYAARKHATNLSEKMVYNVAETPKGGQYQIFLSDGTKVILNAASSLKYPTKFQGTKRIVEISGEGYFEVSKDKNHPFIVKTAKQEIEVLGTHFNVNSYNDEPTVNTNLFEGSIRINGNTYLKPGQQADLFKDGKIIVSKGDVKVMAWKDGKFAFENASLEVVLRQLSRWYDVTIKYQGSIPQMKFTGVIDRNLNASEALEILRFLKVNFKITDKTITVTK